MIGIIDDRKKIRLMIKERIELTLESIEVKLPVVDTPPFQHKEKCVDWINKNGITILLVDEKLKEQSEVGEISVKYNGHELVSIIRKSFKELPVYIVATIIDDKNLTDNLGEYDSVIKRGDFEKNSEQFVLRFIRSAQRYRELHEKELLTLSELSELVATNSAKKKDYDKLRSLQTKLNLPYNTELIYSKQTWLNEFNNKTKELERLAEEIKVYLEK
ncbi:MAG: hypothetical protein P9L97_09755 [Candidatus Tenebribacter davisii]|nr:hypothetical protein [Candidatus Tenebribacter davisii]